MAGLIGAAGSQQQLGWGVPRPTGIQRTSTLVCQSGQMSYKIWKAKYLKQKRYITLDFSISFLKDPIIVTILIMFLLSFLNWCLTQFDSWQGFPNFLGITCQAILGQVQVKHVKPDGGISSVDEKHAGFSQCPTAAAPVIFLEIKQLPLNHALLGWISCDVSRWCFVQMPRSKIWFKIFQQVKLHGDIPGFSKLAFTPQSLCWKYGMQRVVKK